VVGSKERFPGIAFAQKYRVSVPRDKFLDVQGLSLHYLEWGDASAGAPIILVHGFLDHAHSWDAFVACLQQETTVPLWIIAPDCRGHGESGWVGAGGYYHFPDYVRDLDALVRTCEGDAIRLIGHSMGGTISFLFSGTVPARVARLVLIEGVGPMGMEFADAPVRMEKWLSELDQRGRNHFREYSSVEAGARQLEQTNPRLQPELALHLARSGMKQTAAGKWVWRFDPLHRTTSPQPFYSAQAREFLRRITCPVLLIDGEESHHREWTHIQQRIEAIGARQVARIKDAGHMVHQDNPSGLAKVIAPFLFG
jgi:pimeloyl-ACP methyl ester carboxylesterase